MRCIWFENKENNHYSQTCTQFFPNIFRVQNQTQREIEREINRMRERIGECNADSIEIIDFKGLCGKKHFKWNSPFLFVSVWQCLDFPDLQPLSFLLSWPWNEKKRTRILWFNLYVCVCMSFLLILLSLIHNRL